MLGLLLGEDDHEMVVGRMDTKIVIKASGLLAGESYLRDHTDEFYDGTPYGFHANFIKSLVSRVLDASGIAFEMPENIPCQPQKTGPLDCSTIP